MKTKTEEKTRTTRVRVMSKRKGVRSGKKFKETVSPQVILA